MVAVSENVTGPAEPTRKRGLRLRRGDNAGGVGGVGEDNRLDVRNSWQVVAGSILIPLGVVFILLAWYGAAHARVEQQQIPYMVSGSFAGLGCMVVGGLLYWGHWLYRMYDQAALHHEEQQQLMVELLKAIAAGSAATTTAAAGTAIEPTYLATTSGTVYHRVDCPVIAHHVNETRTVTTSSLGALRPCQICSPDQGQVGGAQSGA
jgi:hypothetical protein